LNFIIPDILAIRIIILYNIQFFKVFLMKIRKGAKIPSKEKLDFLGNPLEDRYRQPFLF